MEIKALVLTLVIAVTASVFAIWPVVADAPWEEDVVVPTPVVRERQLSECELITQQVADAQTELAVRALLRKAEAYC